MSQKKNSKGFVSGRFTKSEDQHLHDNYKTKSHADMARALGRDPKSVTNRLNKLGLKSGNKKPKLTAKNNREAYVATLTDTDRKKFFEKEIVASSRYRACQDAMNNNERRYYVEKYVEFMMDPTIETMTSMEKGILHAMILAEIQIQRYMKEEKESKDNVDKLVSQGNIHNPGAIIPVSRAREIKDAQEIIMKCQASLMVERKQRLKDQSDQSVTFTNLIKEMKDPRNRFRLGAEAAMLKVITEQTYNSKLGNNILSGSGRKFDMSKNFRGSDVPELPEEFLPPVGDDESN